MYPSRTPVLYVLHCLTIACAIMLGMYLGCVILGQPLSLLLILGLNFFPDYPLVPHDESDEEEGVYDAEREGTEQQMGFSPPK